MAIWSDQHGVGSSLVSAGVAHAGHASMVVAAQPLAATAKRETSRRARRPRGPGIR